MRISDWSSDVCSSDLPVRHGFVMAARESGASRQDLRDMAAPAGGVFAFPITPRLSGIEDRFHATAHAACSLGFVLPDRLKDFQDVGRANLRNGQFAND